MNSGLEVEVAGEGEDGDDDTATGDPVAEDGDDDTVTGDPVAGTGPGPGLGLGPGFGSTLDKGNLTFKRSKGGKKS